MHIMLTKLFALRQQFVRWFALVCSVIGLGAAHAEQSAVAAERNELNARVLSVRSSLELLKVGEQETGFVAQWFNWPNWGNWGNWGNWNNWNNWGNWFNR
jgi:hypothetical protein